MFFDKQTEIVNENTYRIKSIINKFKDFKFVKSKEQRDLLVQLAKTMNEQPPVKKKGIFG